MVEYRYWRGGPDIERLVRDDSGNVVEYVLFQSPAPALDHESEGATRIRLAEERAYNEALHAMECGS